MKLIVAAPRTPTKATAPKSAKNTFPACDFLI